MNACLSFVTDVRRRLRSRTTQKRDEDELDPRPPLRTFDREMSVQRILLIIGGLSLTALILAASVLHAADSGATPPIAAGRITGEPVGVAAPLGAPPEPSPLAPLSVPAAPPPDLVEDSHSITESVFDHQDSINRHPVDSDRPVIRSTFDREDAVDKHPVP
jgi:hypothetical protein